MSNFSKLSNELVEAGSSTLDKHSFVSRDLNSLKNQLRNPSSDLTLLSDDNTPYTDVEKPISFRLNTTGNIYYSSTSKEIRDETRDLFNSVSVLFSAMTTAMSNKNKSLFDYEAWAKIIRSSGFFVEVGKFRSTMVFKKNQLSINTQIIQKLIPGLTTGISLEIAKNVLESINGEYGSKNVTEDTNLGHILFICEELFGAPSVNVRLFYASKKSHSKILDSPCFKTSKKEFEILQEANTFMFVDPDLISKFASKFKDKPEEYDTLISNLESTLDE